jgi:hypothetical protein
MQIERTLELVREQLGDVTQDRIRHAVRSRRDPDQAIRMLVGTEAEHYGVLLVAALGDADRELTPEQVRELEQMIDDGLAKPD